MDGGFESAQRYVEEFILKDIEKKSLFYDSKTYLQEIVQRDLKKLEYVLLKEEGPDHNKSFEVGVLIDGKQLTTAVGRTRKKRSRRLPMKQFCFWRIRNKSRGEQRCT